MTEKGHLSLKPIRFTSIEYFGEIGSDQLNTDYILSKLITQNILYSAYHQPKTIPEIADLLAIDPSIVEEEVVFLEANGFMNKISTDKYQTTMFITDISDEVSEVLHQIYSEYAKKICDVYIPFVQKNGADIIADKIYTPENDSNFFMWSFIMFACDKKFSYPSLEEELKKYQTIRSNGEPNIAFTSLIKENNLSYYREKYYTNGSIEHYYTLSEVWPVRVFVYNTCYDDRQHGWGRSVSVDPAYLYHFMAGKLNDKTKYSDIIEGLYKKGYLVSKNGSDYVNTVIISMTPDELNDILPPIPNQLLILKEDLDEKVYNLVKNLHPKQVAEQTDLLYKCFISKNEIIARVLEQLLLNGDLKPITDIQKKTVNMIMFSPTHP